MKTYDIDLGCPTPRGVNIGDLVASKAGSWTMPRLVVEIHPTAKALVGTLDSSGETKYIHYKHLEVINEGR